MTKVDATQALTFIPIWGSDWSYKHYSVDDGKGGGPEQWICHLNVKNGETVDVRLRDAVWIYKAYIAKQAKASRG